MNGLLLKIWLGPKKIKSKNLYAEVLLTIIWSQMSKARPT